LTSREKRDLVRNLAEKGLSGIDDFLSSGEPGAISDRLDALRKKMEQELERIKSLRRNSLDDQIRDLSSALKVARRESDDGILDDRSAFRQFSAREIKGEILASELIGALEGRVEIKEREIKRSLLQGIWFKIKGFFSFLLSCWLRFRKWLTSRFRRRSRNLKEETEQRRKGAISIPFPSIRRDVEGWERKLHERLDKDENLQKAVNKSLSESYGYTSEAIRLKQSYDPDWYHDQACKLLHEEIRKSIENKEEQIEKKRSDLLKKRREADNLEMRTRETIMKMERDLENEFEEKTRRIQDISKDEIKKELISKMSQMGYLQRKTFKEEMEQAGTEWEITEALVEKFSELVYSDVMEGRRGRRDRRGTHVSDAGVYDKVRLRMLGEEARMDMLHSIVNSRINHPGDRTIDREDIIVLREVTTTEIHGVIIIDVSGSMEENNRLDAAKRSVLALTQAIKRENPRNRVDLISMSTSSRPISLKEVMDLEPRGFTNLQEALGLACSIFDNSRADRHVLFLITDGLPEAYTDENGKPVAGDMEEAMRKALSQASRLLRYRDLTFNIFLLEPEDEKFVGSARKIARKGEGRVITADPKELANRIIGTYDEGSSILGGI
jgi:Mg-chelatase subunit ChlD